MHDHFLTPTPRFRLSPYLYGVLQYLCRGYGSLAYQEEEMKRQRGHRRHGASPSNYGPIKSRAAQAVVRLDLFSVFQ